MTDGDGDKLPADEPPRLQETAEREAVPLPIPGGEETSPDTAESPVQAEESPAEGSSSHEAPPAPEAAEPPASAEPPAPDEPPASAEPASAPESPAPIEPPFAPEPVAAPPEPPGEGPAGDAAPPPYAPAAGVSDLAEHGAGARPELLVGAAFAGGLLLALVLRRLRS